MYSVCCTVINLGLEHCLLDTLDLSWLRDLTILFRDLVLHRHFGVGIAVLYPRFGYAPSFNIMFRSPA